MYNRLFLRIYFKLRGDIFMKFLIYLIIFFSLFFIIKIINYLLQLKQHSIIKEINDMQKSKGFLSIKDLMDIDSCNLLSLVNTYLTKKGYKEDIFDTVLDQKDLRQMGDRSFVRSKGCRRVRRLYIRKKRGGKVHSVSACTAAFRSAAAKKAARFAAAG